MYCTKLGMAAVVHFRIGIDTGFWETVAVQKADSPSASKYVREGREDDVHTRTTGSFRNAHRRLHACRLYNRQALCQMDDAFGGRHGRRK